MKRVVGYVRVSTEGQAESGLSLEAQREKVRGYCALYDLELIEIIEDAGASAKNLKREGMTRLIELAESGNIEGVVIAKLDRLTRSMRDLHILLERVFSKIELHSVAEQVNTASASGRLVLNVLMSVAEWEREAIGERTSTALQAKKARGERMGRAPYGKRWEEGELVDDEREQEVIACVRELRARGLRWSDLISELETRGIKTRSGGTWCPKTLRKMIA